MCCLLESILVLQLRAAKKNGLRVRLSGTMVIAALIDAKADLHHLNKKGGTTMARLKDEMIGFFLEESNKS